MISSDRRAKRATAISPRSDWRCSNTTVSSASSRRAADRSEHEEGGYLAAVTSTSRHRVPFICAALVLCTLTACSDDDGAESAGTDGTDQDPTGTVPPATTGADST